MNAVVTNIVNYSICIISIVITIITTIVGKIKAKKEQDKAKCSVDKELGEKEEFKSRLGFTEDLLTILTEILPTSITMAEQAGVGINGATKKLLAISDIIQKCSVKGIDYNVYAKDIENQLEATIDLTNNVNTHK